MSLLGRLQLFEHSPLVTWVDQVDPVRVIWANQAAIDLFQARDLDEIRARDFSKMPEATKIQRQEWMEAFRDGRARNFEREWTLYPAGVPTRAMLYVSHIELEDGEPGFLFQAVPKPEGTAPNIMRDAEVVRHTSAAVALLSREGEVLQRNPAAMRAFGAGRPFSEWFEDPAMNARVLARVDSDEVLRAELSSHASGTTRDYSLEARRCRDPVSGKNIVLVHLLDETARLGAERESAERGRLINELSHALALVERQQQRWRSLVDSAPDHVMIINRDHGIEFANREFERSEPSAPPLAGQQVETLFEPNEQAALHATIEGVFEAGETRSYETTTTALRGTRAQNLRFGPIKSNEGISQLTMIATDVTAQRELELQLRHSQKMEAVGTLAGGVAHDFNNLLTVIAGACDIFEIELEADHPTRPLLDDINDAIERAANLTKRLLVFSRKQQPECTRVELSRLVVEISTLLMRGLDEQVRLNLSLCEAPCWVLVDPGQLEQLLINLAFNARDAMPEGGVLTLATRVTGEDDARVALEVSDTGAGMSEELQARIFEPFFTTKEPGKGTGLGLSVVHSIAEQHGGRLEVDSVVGRGTCIRLLLTRAE